MKKLGVIINPIAGIGGRVGLKGSDGIETLRKAREMGSEPLAPTRAIQALQVIHAIKDEIETITYPGEMGQNELCDAGFQPTVIGLIKKGETTSNDTIKAAQDMLQAGVDLLLFAGGDGTARNIYSAVGNQLPVLGIPAGVKIHSSVYAINPRSAGKAAVLFLQDRISRLQEAEVMDIDEAAFRQGRVNAKLYGYLQVPQAEDYVQNVKSGGYCASADLNGLAAEIVDKMEPDTLYLIGPGTTTRSIMELLNIPNTLLGIDAVMNRQLVASDANEHQLWDLIQDKKVKIVVTPIGGQGHLFGRGNQQLSPRIIRKAGKENILIVATKEKLLSLPSCQLLTDTGDPDLDEHLTGFMKTVTGYGEQTICRVVM